MSGIENLLSPLRIIPVLVIEDAADSLPLAEALIEGGLTVLEVTLRTPVAADALSRMKKAFPDALVGAGTVVDAQRILTAENAGADFLVSPGCSADLLDAAQGSSLPFIPGVSTTSEAMTALSKGFTLQKFFPAQLAGGPAFLKSLATVLPDVRFMPTGGINPQNVGDYLALANVAAVGGTWIAPAPLVTEKRWSAIRDLATEAHGLTTNSI